MRTRISKQSLAVLLGSGLLAATVMASEVAPGTVAKSVHMPLSEVEPGQKGYGLTVFKGDRIERFDVEIIGTLQNITPKQSIILAKVSGPILDHAGVIAGMSGSPIYIDDRLIGALAYSWQFSKDPICGITPIESMFSINRYEDGPPVRGVPLEPIESAAFLRGLITKPPSEMFETYLAQLRAFNPSVASSGVLPLALPISISGLGGRLAAPYCDVFAAFGAMPVPAGSSGSAGSAGTMSDEAPKASGLVPGSAVASVLVRGDLVLAASGTVTSVEGDRILAFGHPFLELGPVEMPMAHSQVLAVLPNLNRSFKFSTTGDVIGSVRQDRANGLLGVLGTSARMIPLEVRLRSGNSREETYNFEVLRASPITPLLLAVALDNVLTAAEKASGDSTIFMDVDLALTGRPAVRIREVFSGPAAKDSAPAFLGLLTNYLLANEYAELAIESIGIELSHTDSIRQARLLDVSISDSEVRAGQWVRLTARLETYRGDPFDEVFEMQIPPETPPGKLFFFVGDGPSLDRIDLAVTPPAIANLDQALAMLNRLRSQDRLEVAGYRLAAGSQVEGETLPLLPPSSSSLVHGAAGSVHGRLSLYKQLGAGRSLPLAVSGLFRVELEVKRNIL